MTHTSITAAQQGQLDPADSSASSPERSQQDAPLFSVVIATYNYGHLIERAIDSVLSQTFTDFELIVVDDGSTDDTRSRVSKYGESIRYLPKVNGGQSSAYNLGADQAIGRYIYILDADDELLPEALAHFAAAVSDPHFTHPSLFYGGYVSVAESGSTEIKRSVEAPADAKQRLKRFLRRQITGLQNCTTVIPREFFKRFRYPEQLRNNTDIVFYGQIIANHPAFKLDVAVARIHDHPQRTRKQLDRIVAAGTKPVDALFDPQIISPELMSLRRTYLAQRLRSIARMLYLGRDYRAARDAYWSALFTHPVVMLQFSSIKRLVVATAKSLSGSDQR